MKNELGYNVAFDKLFFSCCIGHRKPDPNFFSYVINSLHIDPSETLLIDDSVANVEAAIAIGMKGTYFSHIQGASRLMSLLDEHLQLDA